MKTPAPMVEVTWLDTSGNPGWQEELNTEPLEVKSVGYLAHKSKRSLVLATASASRSVHPFGHTMTIPRVCVKRIRRLR